jgi:hypothetical protein
VQRRCGGRRAPETLREYNPRRCQEGKILEKGRAARPNDKLITYMPPFPFCEMRRTFLQGRIMNFRTNNLAAALLIASISLIPHTARAADSEKVERLLQVLKIDQQMDKMKEMMEKSVEQGFVATAKKKGMTQAQLDRGQPVIAAMAKKIFDDSFSWDFFKPRFANVYVEELTNDEVDAAIAYYSSPQGQSMIAKMPVLMQRGMDIGMKRGQEMAPQIDAAMEAAFKQIRKDDANASEEEKKIAEKNAEAAEKAVKDNSEKMDASPAK